MPRFNASGTLAAFGVGDGPLWLLDVATRQGRIIVQPGGPCAWIDDDRIAFQTVLNGRYERAAYSVSSGAIASVGPPGANSVAAGGGKVLWWTAGTGVSGSVYSPIAGLSPSSTDSRGEIGHDGTLALKPDYHGDGIQLIAPNGEVTATLPGVLGLQVLGPRIAIWNSGALGWNPQRLPGENWTRVAEVNGVLWLVSWLEGVGLVAHRADDASRGYAVTRSDAFYHDAVGKDGRLFVVYSTNQGESFGSGVLVDVFAECQESDLEPTPEPIPDVNRTLWFGSFDLDKDATFPGNCRIVRTQGVPWLMLETMDGRPIARYVAGDPDGDPEAIERAINAALGPLPVLSYVPTGVRLPRNLDWLGLEAYRKTWETAPQFEAARRQRAQEAGRPVILIPQCYTSNANNVPHLRPLVPIFGRFLRDVPNCIGAVAFSAGSWRRTGYEDHPEVHADYHRLARTIQTPVPGQDPLDPPEPPDPPDPPGDDMHIRIYDYDKSFVRGGPNAHLGVDNAFQVEPDQGRRITEVEVGAEGGGRRIKVRFPDENGEECRGLRFKPTIDGDHKFLVRAWDNHGQEAFSYGAELIRVTTAGEPPDVPPGDDTTFPFPALLRQFAARYPVPQTPGGGDAHEELCRQWSIKFAEQVVFKHGQSYGVKRAAPNRPISKDSLARQVSRTVLWSWDLLVGTGTGSPVVADDPAWHDISGQVFEPVTPVDHL